MGKGCPWVLCWELRGDPGRRLGGAGSVDGSQEGSGSYCLGGRGGWGMDVRVLKGKVPSWEIWNSD